MSEEKVKKWDVNKTVKHLEADKDNIVVGIHGGEEIVPREALYKKKIKKMVLADGSTEDIEESVPDIGALVSKKAQDAGLKNIVVEINGQEVEPADVQDMHPETIETINIRPYDAPR